MMTRTAVARGVPISVIVPTLNEAENIDSLLIAVLDHGRREGLDLEVIVVDDGSRDGTRERVAAWGRRGSPVRLLTRDGERGLSSAVVAGARSGSGEIAVVMDADLSHPPEKIAELVRPILDGRSDMVIGSRHVPGGSTPGWPLRRRITSRGAAALAWPLVDARDPLSGFFAVRREILVEAGRDVAGFKIGLEVLVKGGDRLRVEEVPITFRDRTRGQSKLDARVMGHYLKQLRSLAGLDAPKGSRSPNLAALVAGFLTDFLSFQLLLAAGWAPGLAHQGSFAVAAAVVVGSILWPVASGRSAALPGGPSETTVSAGAWTDSLGRSARYVFGGLLGVFLRGGVLAMFMTGLGWHAAAAFIPALAAGAVGQVLGHWFASLVSASAAGGSGLRWRLASFFGVIYLFLLRLLYIGQIDLTPEEAYYWNYSEHIDIGYLDHPPMVAWLIHLGTSLFGQNEFGVRIGATACWTVGLIFIFLLTRNLLGKSAAFRSAFLFSALPFFFAAGGLMMPDSPLVASWAGLLYFLERALLAERRRAWWGAGACLGLGLLSKYPIALVAAAAGAFLVVDRRSRRWFSRPEPYLAVVLALILFLPVIIWNARHEWASFLFQGAERWEHEPRFDLPLLAAWVFILITPLGFAGFFEGLLRIKGTAPRPSALQELAGERRAWLFCLVFTMVPLSVFCLSSLRNQTKINWTGPVWLAALPAMAASMVVASEAGRVARIIERSWRPVGLVLVILYGLGLHWPVLSLAGFAPPANYYGMNWEQLGREVEEIEEDLIRTTGNEPVMVGMDKYHIASEIAFYDPALDGAWETTGKGIFGRGSLMYDRWFPKEKVEGKSLVLVSPTREGLRPELVRPHVKELELVRELPIHRLGKVVGRYYVQIAHGYHRQPLEAGAPAGSNQR